MNTQWMKARQTKYTGYVVVYVVVIVAVLALANFLAQRYNKSWDSTTNKQFSLSDQTIKVVKGLTQDVTIDYFDKTSNLSDPRGNARDLLDRYANLSSKVHVNYVDPTKKPEIAKAAGVRAFGTTYIQAAGRRQEAKSVSEEEITGALIRALKGGERLVCAVTGSGEHGLDAANEDGYSSAKEMLEKNNYKTQTINLLQKQEIPKECNIVFVGGPRLDYVPAAADAIKKYVEGGGRVLLALDAPLQFQGQEIAPNKALAGVLAGWGVTLDDDLVIDPNPVNRLFGFDASVVLVNEYESHQIVRDMRGASAFPLIRSMEVKAGDKTTVDKLFSSSSDAFGATNLTSPRVNPSDPKNKKGPLVLAAAGTYNTGQPNNNGRFVVAGSSYWIANNILPSRSLANRDLFLNMMNWLSSDEDLISIRPKEPENRPLAMTVRQMRMLFYSTILFLPLLILASGLSVWWRRR
ncbi:MAG: GldG family protein [Acidobacteria bacterium]|nr:GldG family protein [Acidobacteriota bacterium]